MEIYQKKEIKTNITYSDDYLLLSTNDINLANKIIDIVLEYSDNV